MKRFFPILLVLLALLLTGCHISAPQVDESTVSETTLPVATEATTVPTTAPDPVQALLDSMSLEEKVGQLFLARCDDSVALQDIKTFHLSGFVLFGADFDDQTPESMAQKLQNYQSAAKYPMLIAVDEEGGTVNRISRLKAFRSSPFPSARSSYESGGMEQVLTVEEEKCQLLTSLGINVNLGPVCDMATDPDAFMYSRSLGGDAETTSNFVSSTVRLMSAYQVGSVLKHFPGYGNNTDTHTGIAVDNRSLEELEEKDLLPFAAGFQAGAGAVMVSHTIVTALDDTLPASLSPAVHSYLRNEMGYTGVIITDDLVMQAITDLYGAGEAAVMAVQAGNDLLCSTEYVTQYDAVLTALLEGRISMDTLNSAVTHVLEWKMSLGLL